VSGRLTRDPLPETRDGEAAGWGGVKQWVEELTFAVLEHGAAAFIYLLPPGDSISDTTLGPLGTRSRARCPRSNRQALTSSERGSAERQDGVTQASTPTTKSDHGIRGAGFVAAIHRSHWLVGWLVGGVSTKPPDQARPASKSTVSTG